MKRLFTIMALLAPNLVWSNPEPPPPNILLIFVDDLGYGDPGCYGGNRIPTPNIDRLAAGGIRFTDGYVTASVCGPSRLGLLSGAYQQRFGCYWNNDLWAKYKLKLPDSQRLIPEALDDAGYTTGHIGKWNITTDPRPFFDEVHSVMCWKGAYYPDAQGKYLGVDGPDFKMEPHGWGPDRGGGEYLTDRLTGHAIEFIHRHAKKKFFLYLAYNAPHTPLQAEGKYKQVFANLPDEPNRLYAGMVASLDQNIGRVLCKLQETGIEKNTLVVFISDNGPARGSGYLKGWRDDWPKSTLLGSVGSLNGHKARQYEGGIRVPFIMRWPSRFKAGQIYSQPVSTLDVYPTLCAAGAAQPPKGTILDGVNLLPYLTGRALTPPHDVLFWRSHQGGAVRRGDWKLLIQPKGRRQLFNLRSDVGETQDLSRQRPELVNSLYSDWRRWSVGQAPAVSERGKK